MNDPASPEGVWDKEIAFQTEGPTAEYLVALQEQVNNALQEAETVKEGQALPSRYVLGYQDSADSTGQVVVTGHYFEGEVVSTDVYWPSGKDYTLVSKDALRLLLKQVKGATWHEGAPTGMDTA